MNNAVSTFFVRIGQIGRAAEAHRDDYTLPLFPLWLILDADGTLADDCAALSGRKVETRAERSA